MVADDALAMTIKVVAFEALLVGYVGATNERHAQSLQTSNVMFR